MDPRVGPLATTLSLNTRLLPNCLDGVTDEQALARPSSTTNSIGFVAHVCDSRHFLLRFLGADAPSPFPELETAKSIEDVRSLPDLSAIRTAWDGASQRLSEQLQGLTAEFLDATSPMRFSGH